VDLSRLLLPGLVLLLATAPVFLGSNRPAFWPLQAGLIGALLVIWALSRRGEPAGAELRALTLPALLTGMTALWILLQVLPIWPAGIAHPAWDAAGQSGLAPITPSVGLTLDGLIRLASYAGLFFLTVVVARSSEKALALLWAVAAIGAVYAALGIGLFLAGDLSISFQDKSVYHGRLTGAFVNPNLFAGFLGVTLVVLSGLLFRAAAKSMRHSRSKRWLRLAQALESLVRRDALLVLAWIIVFAALVMTGSRGGLAVTGIAVLGLLLLFVGTGRLPRLMLVPAGVLGAVFVAFILSVAGDGLGERLSQTSVAADDRIPLYRLTMAGIGDAPLLGHGYGAYRDAFPAYRDATIGSEFPYHDAHNNWLETIFGLGIPAALVLFSALGLIGWRLIRGVADRRRGKYFPMIGLGAALLVGLHALIDSPMTMPAVAYVFLVLVGIGFAQSFSREA